MTIIKLTNGNVELQYTNGRKAECLQPNARLQKDSSRQKIKIIYGQNNIFSIALSEVDFLQVEPAAAVAFSGTLQELFDELKSNFFFDISGSGGNGRYYPSGQGLLFFDTDGITATSLTLNTLYARLAYVEGPVTIESMIGRFSASVAGAAVFGIYTIGNNGYPDKLLATSAPINSALTTAQVAPLNTDITLPGGYYALVYNASVTNTFNCSPSASVWPTFGYNQTIIAAGNLCVYTAAYNYNGTLPTTFPAGTLATVNPPFLLCKSV